MASSTFRDSINNLGWSRREADIPVNTSRQNGGILSSLQSLNPFGDRGYVQLPTSEPGAPLPAPTRREEEEGWFARESYPIHLLPPFPLSCSSTCPCSRPSKTAMCRLCPARVLAICTWATISWVMSQHIESGFEPSMTAG